MCSDPKCPQIITSNSYQKCFRYLAGTIDIGLWYPRDEDFNILGYSYADYARYKIDRKSTSRYYQFLGHSLISWHSKK